MPALIVRIIGTARTWAFWNRASRPGVNGPLISSGEMKHRLFMVVLVIAIVLAMKGWVYALGWIVLKLI